MDIEPVIEQRRNTAKKIVFSPRKMPSINDSLHKKRKMDINQAGKGLLWFNDIYSNGPPGSLAFETAGEALTGIYVLRRDPKVFSNVPSLPRRFPFSLDMQLVWTEIHWKCEKHTRFQGLCGKKEKNVKYLSVLLIACWTDNITTDSPILIIFNVTTKNL